MSLDIERVNHRVLHGVGGRSILARQHHILHLSHFFQLFCREALTRKEQIWLLAAPLFFRIWWRFPFRRAGPVVTVDDALRIVDLLGLTEV